MPVEGFAEYDGLAPIIKFQISKVEYAWLSDGEKAELQQTMTTPDRDSEDQAW